MLQEPLIVFNTFVFLGVQSELRPRISDHTVAAEMQSLLCFEIPPRKRCRVPEYRDPLAVERMLDRVVAIACNVSPDRVEEQPFRARQRTDAADDCRGQESRFGSVHEVRAGLCSKLHCN